MAAIKKKPVTNKKTVHVKKTTTPALVGGVGKVVSKNIETAETGSEINKIGQLSMVFECISEPNEKETSRR